MQKKLRAIVIDDMAFCRELLTDVLETRGYEVLSFADVTFCNLFPPRNAKCPNQNGCADFLLTDNRMPLMQGIDLLEQQAQGKCHIKTTNKAIFSAHWSREERETAEQFNCKVFHKPYSLAALETWLDEQEKLVPTNRTLLDPCDLLTRREPQTKDQAI